MPGTLWWANSDELVFSHTFLITKSLWDTETYLSRVTSCYRWDKDAIRDSLHWSRRFEYPWVLRRLSPSKEDIVMDAGAGAAILQFVLSHYVKELHSIDIEPKWTTMVEDIKRDSGMFDNIITTQADIMSLPYPDDFFDKSVSVSVLEHMPPLDIRPGIDEIMRVTKKKAFITMDVCLYRLDDQPSDIIEMDPFIDMCKDLDINVPPLPKSVMAGSVDNNYIIVACMEIWK